MRNKNRTVKGDELKAKHQATYSKWWLNKIIKAGQTQQKVVEVRYIGNSVYGSVILVLEDGSEYVPPCYGFRPTKDSVVVIPQ